MVEWRYLGLNLPFFNKYITWDGLNLIILFCSGITNMKRSLALPRRDKPTGDPNKALAKKLPIKIPEERVNSIEKTVTISRDVEQENTTQKYQQKYRNKNLNVLPIQMLVTLSALTTIDISYNQLTDSQIQLVMKSCSKLSTFCMQGNIATLIPATISNLKQLKNFRHDWVKLNPLNMYQPSESLHKMKEIAVKPECVMKINKIVGMDFGLYCHYILNAQLNKSLMDKIQKCDCSTFARKNMLKYMEDIANGKVKQKQKLSTIQEGEEKSLIPGCFGNLNFQQPTPNKKRQDKWKQTATNDYETVCTNIKIEDIRDITDKEMTIASVNDAKSEDLDIYACPGYPLHQIFANFDRNSNAATDVDGMLIRGLNPNQYDANGLSPFHLCVINRQKKGIQFLVQICSNNPGFFDLEMPSLKECRSLLHFAVFLKNFQITKILIQFGLPVDRRDGSGARIVHLVDQNYEFLLLLRKALKKRTIMARSLNVLSVPTIASQKKKNYTKHPLRQKQQSRIRITYSTNDKLLQMYETATGISTVRK